jgi:AcrR family transcriptional regulator
MREAHPKERILRVATQLFKEKGFANVSVREICQGSGVSLPMVYYYFKDKRGLFQAVIREQVTLHPLLDALEKIVQSQGAVEKRLQALIYAYLGSFPKDLLNAGFYLRERTQFDRGSMSRFAADLARVHALIAALIQEGVEQRSFRRTDCGKAADCLLGMMNRFIAQQAHFHRDYDPQETGAYILEFTLQSLKEPSCN